MENKIIKQAGCIVKNTFLLICFGASMQVEAQTIKTPTPETIQKRYQGKWPTTLTYLVTILTKRYGRESITNEYHAYLSATLSRVDKGSPDDGNAAITHGDSTFLFKKFKKAGFYNTSNYVSDYMSRQIYFANIQQVKKAFRESHIDLTQSCRGTWQGREVYVIGASTTDDTYHTQVWYDAKHLYPVRFIDQLSGSSRDTQYQMKLYGEIWFPVSATEYINKKPTAEISYTEVSFGKSLDPDIFNLENFGAVHWYQPH